MDNRLAGLGRTFRPFPSLAGRGKKAGLGTAARLRKIEDFSKASPNLDPCPPLGWRGVGGGNLAMGLAGIPSPLSLSVESDAPSLLGSREGEGGRD